MLLLVALCLFGGVFRCDVFASDTVSVCAFNNVIMAEINILFRRLKSSCYLIFLEVRGGFFYYLSWNG